MASIEPYRISVPDDDLKRLHAKLDVADFPDELDEAGWDYGAPLADIKRLTTYWKDGFDWRKQEIEMNRLPNFQTKIELDGFETLNIHFVYQKSDVKNAIPLLFVHGWPGNFLELEKILPLLTKGGKDILAFHVVAPSLPNFGFSDGIKKRGFGLRQYAETCNKLMLQLGYDQYAAHINFVRPSSAPKFTSFPLLALQHATTPYSALEEDGVARSEWFQKEGSGYNELQSTKPQTLGYGLHDSPVALLAWIYEKLHDWTDNYPWTDDEILTWVSIYWFSTAGPAASVRIYYENRHSDAVKIFGSWIPKVKWGLSYFPRDLCVPPRAWGRTLGEVVFEKEHKDGGHFAAHERPEKLVGDLREMFGKGGGAEGVVEGRSGFA